eukprot:CAMPEP_0173420262 /NCGR_PEP_ID=MMETSP1357-20121228/1828_1 /TAXON_ID=77926 /ORGANISM="Hemiselmis rufescens, Strain PCC563" /LENGTH=382 /DNA_ID=CAMNT_0014383041 /DNA_START=33 /DNA_END=1181 /DNA_ORIENTATION=+
MARYAALVLAAAMVAALSPGASGGAPGGGTQKSARGPHRQTRETRGSGGALGGVDKEAAAGARRQAPPPGRFTTTECTSAVPAALSLLGLDNVCADIDLAGCGSNVSIAMRWASQRPPNYLLTQTFDVSSGEQCGSAPEFAQTALASVCGEQAKLCISFLDSRGATTLRIGPGYASGCPIVDIKDCRAPLTGELSSFQLPLDCFSQGKDCMHHATCDSCIEAGCGWCTAGYKSEFACMSGDRYGPVCDVCGQGGGCNWNYGVCPIAEEELIRRDTEFNQTKSDLAAANAALGDLKEAVQGGGKVKVQDHDYECENYGALASARSASTAVGVVSSILCLLAGLVAGGFLGKAGHVDRLLAFSRMKDGGPSLSTTDSAYVPPDL